MSTTPPEDYGPGREGPRPLYGVNMPNVARLPVPGNAEFALYVVVEVIFIFIWIFADSVNTSFWVTVTTVLTFGYILSRGIAKAGKVLEH
jgi:hypothetical protein